MKEPTRFEITGKEVILKSDTGIPSEDIELKRMPYRSEREKVAVQRVLEAWWRRQ